MRYYWVVYIDAADYSIVKERRFSEDMYIDIYEEEQIIELKDAVCLDTSVKSKKKLSLPIGVSDYRKASRDEELESLAKQALEQINNRMYYMEMNVHGGRDVLKYGIAFLEKRFVLGQR